MILAIILLTLDLLTTWYITSNGGVELNPLGQNSITLFLLLKLFVLMGLSVLTILARKWKIKSKTLNIFFIIFDMWYIIAVIHNIINILVFWLN